MRLAYLVVVFSFLISPLGIAISADEPLLPNQKWKSAEGKEISATVLRVEDRNVVFLMQGKKFVYPLSGLSEDSQVAIRSAQAAKLGSLPGETISFLCIRVNFADRKIYADNDAKWAADLTALFEFAEPYYRLQSYKKIASMPFRISEVFTIDQSWAEFKGKEHELSQRVRGLAVEAGWKLEQYDHIVLSFPSIEGNYGALGMPGTVWMPGENPWPPGFAHELGHAFAVGHAGTWEGGHASWPAVHDEGSDAYFTMGSGPVGAAWNLPMKVKKNWVLQDQIKTISIGTKSVHRLYQFDVPKLTTKGPVGLRANDFWLSYAPNQIHWLKDGVPRDLVQRGLFIHTMHGELTRLIDCNPSSRMSPDRKASHLDPFHDSKDAPLAVGRTLTIERSDVLPGYRIHLKPLRVGGRKGELWIDVEVDLQELVDEDPLVAEEGFGGSSESLIGRDGGYGWTGFWRGESGTATGRAEAIATGLSYSNLRTSGGALKVTAPKVDDDTLILSRKLHRTVGMAGSSIWCSFLMESNQPRIGDMLVTLGDNFSLAIGKPWGEHFGIYIDHSTASFREGETQLVVARFDFQDSTCKTRLWINPSLTVTPRDDQALVERADVFETCDELKIRLQGHGSGSYILDEIRVGTSYSSVVPTQ